ncbi:conserved hypothetical protein [Vibrio owensii]|uniref:Uncharacterized protein n=1 Tax=Vibrio owensii TaxID=696485 RepID=A0AAU9Q0K7_9VIBR|nr:conserved hypothetical protein [Vibrio owensii]
MKSLKNLKGYSQAQRNLAYSIREKITAKLDLSKTQDNRVYDRLMSITSPMFFIKYRSQLESGKITEALSKYQDDNYNRRARHVTRG